MSFKKSRILYDEFRKSWKIWKIVFQFYKNNDPFNKVFSRTSRELYSKKIGGLIFSRKRRAKRLIIANNFSFNFQTMTKIRSEDGFITKRSFLDCYWHTIRGFEEIPARIFLSFSGFFLEEALDLSARATQQYW